MRVKKPPVHRVAILLTLTLTGMLMGACAPRLTDTPLPTTELVVEATATEIPPTDIPPTATATIQPSVPLLLEPAQTAFAIPLHLQHKTERDLTVLFEFDAPTQGELFWWTDQGGVGQAKSVPFNSDQLRHLIAIDGLSPATTYQVAVGIEHEDGHFRLPTFMGELWPAVQIRTHSESIFPLRIGVFGDSGFGEDLTVSLAEQLAQHQPDMILHTGDLVYLASQQPDARAAFQLKWYQTLSSLLQTSVIYPVIGNHELDRDTIYQGDPYYFHAFPMLDVLAGGWEGAPEGRERQWYALELGSIQIVFLNTQQLYGGSGRAEQDAWLKTRLNDERFKETIVIFHVPPYTSGRHQLDGTFVARNWVPLFEQANVPLVLSGHDHNYERLEQNGITYVVSGGGSSVLYSLGYRLDQSKVFLVETHFLLLELTEEQITLEAIGVDGEILDTTIIQWSN